MSASGLVGLLIVHGIGDPPPGAALTDFTDALAGHGLATFEPDLKEARLVDPSRSTSRQTRFFPVTFRHGQSTGPNPAPVVAAEVFWGSASQLSPGRLGVLQGIVSLMINVPALLVGANGGHKTSPGVVPWLTRVVSLLLSGPAFALNGLLLSAFVFHVAGAYVSSGTPASDFLVPWLAMAGAIALGFLPWIRFPETRWSFWLIGPFLFASFLLYAAVGRPETILPTTEAFATCAVYAIELLVAVVALAQLGAIGWFVVRLLIRGWDQRLWTSVLATSLQLGIWTMLIPTVWDVLVTWMPEKSRAAWIGPLYTAAAQSDGRQWPLVGAVGVVFLVVLAGRKVHEWLEVRRLAEQVVTPASARPCARVIVHPAVAASVLVVTVVGCGLILIGTAMAPFPHTFGRLGDWLTAIPKYQVTTPLAVAASLVMPQLRLGLDLVHDVISYLHYRCDVGRGVLRRYGGMRQKVHDPVRIRFDLALLHLVHALKAERVVIVAHSQGSMMVLDELAQIWPDDQLPADVSVVTFGSPMSHIYQHYFPDLYPDWSSPRWQTFFGRVGRWINVYRLADYVGTTIEAPPLRHFDQMTLGSGGHTNYWTDARLMTALEGWGLFA
jgi:hypothetical protein